MPHPATLFLQIGVILLAARIVGWLFRKIQQPQVVGEMVAGVLLGPSLLGRLAPGLSATLFPPDSLGFLGALSQVGVALFMFLVGLELDPQALRGQKRAAVLTSQASIALPFALGTLLAWHLHARYAPAGVPFLHFTLFMGTAMSITAFPVLARILTERNLLRTPVGAAAIACAAVDDASAWFILAGVVLLVRAAADTLPLWLMILGSAAYVGLMLSVGRRTLRRVEAAYRKRGEVTRDLLAIVLVLVLGSALATEWLGIHALFGAFLMGAVMPKERGFVRALSTPLEGLTVVLLLPLFFAFTGLRARIGLVSGWEMWLSCALIILTAIAGKFGGSALAARLGGMRWREAAALGILLNTRGLMELVILNIGLDVGVISPEIFAMMVLMALVTTFRATPLLMRIYPAAARGAAPSGAAERGIA